MKVGIFLATRWMLTSKPYMKKRVELMFYPRHTSFISKLKSVGLKILPIDLHLGFAMVFAKFPLQLLAVYNTNLSLLILNA